MTRIDATYRTLTAALALGEFTVTTLAEEAGVNDTTIRTVLNRNRSYFLVEATTSGRRGGQPQIWKVRPDNRETLEALVKGINDKFGDQKEIGLELSETGQLSARFGPPLRAPSSNPEFATSDDLDAYFLQPSIDLLPRLVRRLLLEAQGVTALNMPGGEGILLRGYDGHVSAEADELFVPAGVSVWELGAGRDPLRKAEEDLAKRSANHGDIDPADATFVFVTIRRFPKRYEWLERHRGDGVWRDIQVIDADDLSAWVERFPAVHTWLSAEMGLHPADVVTLRNWFDAWRSQTDPPLPPKILLAGRQTASDMLRRDASKPGRVIGVLSGSRQESLAFIAATLLEEDETDAPTARLASALLVRTPQEWVRLVDSMARGVLVPEFPEANLAAATGHGLTVVLPLGPGSDSRRATVELPRIDVTQAIDQLVEAKVRREEAERIAHEVDRSLPSFRRSNGTNPDYTAPSWVSTSADLIASLVLLGGWEAESKPDQEIVAAVADRNYNDIESSLKLLALHEDPPFFESGSGWQVSSAQDAFALVGRAMAAGTLDRWRTTAVKLLPENNADDGTVISKELEASARGSRLKRSTSLRNGVARAAALLGAFGERSQALHAGLLVRELLGDSAGPDTWVALSPVLPALAEAAPDEFLENAEDAVRMGLLKEMFTDAGTAPLLGRRSAHTELLWSLELLCRSPHHAARACEVLAALDEIDPGGRGSNRPFDSLRRVLLPWHPQIAATADERLDIIEGILDRRPDVGWKLLMSLLPGQWDSTNPTYAPVFRPWMISLEISVAERFASWRSVTQLTIQRAAAGDPSRLLEIVETIQTLQPDDREALIGELSGVDFMRWDPLARLGAWRTLRELVARHRQFPDAQWVMPNADLRALEKVLSSWEPDDPVDRFMHLFVNYPVIPIPHGSSQAHAYEQEVERLRHEALGEIVSDATPNGMLRLIEGSGEPFTAGYAIANEKLDEVASDMLGWLGRDDALGIAARGWLVRMEMEPDADWFKVILGQISALDPKARIHAYSSLPYRDEVLDLIPNETLEVQAGFWRVNPVLLLKSNRIEQIATGLLDNGRPRSALSFLAHKVKSETISAGLLLRALRETGSGTEEPIVDAMIDYEVGELLDALEEQDTDEDLLANFEWMYFAILQHSRPPRALFRRLATDPEFFVELVRIVYRGAHEEPSEEEFDVAAHARWRASYAVLKEWRTPPGTRTDGTVDGSELTTWTHRARELLAAADRTDVGDQCVGEILSGSPEGSDGIWPAESVRRLLEVLTGNHVREGVEIGRFNSRGVTNRGMYEGGRQERALAETYDDWSRRVAPRWPNTARILRDLARTYREWGDRQDTRDEQWRDHR